ncbi:winged helix-turn-helix domain-containing protein [Altericroceibacterium xinjiangense]|uniref:winged helix-turn-helix domain-containing protein n=1 Tax=Altericroceibacterium xinjiangense TaxID=762261 RepID=UPI000F7EC443|nr:transcriptional regulator [Altericroceibacterium xinjiangense]
MSNTARQFGLFRLDLANRRLLRGDEVVDLPARYLDVLILLVSAEGDLVTKDRFMDEVWRGVPVTDEALTQAVRTLRKALGDSAGAPRFIETVPKYGYRFIAPISSAVNSPEKPGQPIARCRPAFIRETAAGMTGALLAGGLVGLLYGSVGAAQPTGSGGAVSLLLVIVLVSTLSAGAAGAGIAAGIALSRFIRPLHWYWTMIGGALGGVTLGALANMIGKDAFRLLLGQTVGPFTGAMEGLVVGAAAGLASFLVQRQIKHSLGLAPLLGAGAGLIVVMLDGQLMAGSLQTLVTAFPSSQFRLDKLGRAFGEQGIGSIARVATATFEGAVFALALVRAMHPPRHPVTSEHLH